MDALLINPDSSSSAYQELAKQYSAIEPPTWALLLAESSRSKGFEVAILDCDAERLNLEQSIERITYLKPKLIVFVVYGQNPNSGTTNMIGAFALARRIKDDGRCLAPIVFVGSHTSALPMEVLSNSFVDIVLLNEGVYALHNLLKSNLSSDLGYIKGIGYKKKIKGHLPILTLNPPQPIVPQDRMDHDLPGYAWDLLPYKNKPLDLYRAHFWHAKFDHEKRTPFAAIYTSLGCNFSCDFCMINIINRENNSNNINSSDSRVMRFWSSKWVQKEMEKLAKLGVYQVRINDEMFFLNRKYYQPIIQNIIDQNFNFNLWAYSRIDTIRNDMLELFKKAGVDWLALGVESGNQVVRQDVAKGSFKEIKIHDVCSNIRNSGINIISNYIFGLPDDTLETMNETLKLAMELNTEMANMYPCQALPGSPMYHIAKKNDWKLPKTFEGYAFLSYESEPLPTKTLNSSEVLRFRDQAWQKYFSNKSYLELIERKFGLKERQNIDKMSKIRLKRKLLGD